MMTQEIVVVQESQQIDSLKLSKSTKTIEIAGYKLVHCSNEKVETWRCFRGFGMLGLLFQYPTHWSNGIDRIKYAQAEDAALGLEDWRKLGVRKTGVHNE